METPDPRVNSVPPPAAEPAEPEGPAKSSGRLSRSPLTDLRALGGSLTFHMLVLLLTSLVALHVALPREPEGPKVLRAEIGPVDNRARADLTGAGGGPGDLGGLGLPDSPLVSVARSVSESEFARDPAAEALLSEVLPSAMSSPADSADLPGPATSGVGVLPGPGTGGGGGTGGGTGGGVGRGIGPGTQFFGAHERAGSFAYVIDCSGSMIERNALGVAKAELLTSLAQLPPDAQFGVVFYNLNATTLTDTNGRPGLMAATASNKVRVRSRLVSIEPEGGTNHMVALRAGLALHPEVIFFLTDAASMTIREVEEILEETGSTRIQAIEFGVGPALGGSPALRKLAQESGGSYRYLDVTTFVRPTG